MIESVTDYLLATTDGTAADTDTCDPAGTGGAVPLAPDLTLEVLDAALSRRLMRACELRGERWDPTPQFGIAQAFVHIVDPRVAVERQQLYAWDPDQTLFSALALSRLVRPHATACDYAVRRVVDTDGSEQLVPHDAQDARVAFRLDQTSRGWLDADEAEQLRSLVSAYAPQHLPGRVRRAWWQCESMVRERYLEDTLLLIVSGLESLLKLGRRHVTEQFVQRTSALAAEFSIVVTEDQARSAYDDRSGISHGTPTDLTQPATRTEFVKRTDLLQQTLPSADATRRGAPLDRGSGVRRPIRHRRDDPGPVARPPYLTRTSQSRRLGLLRAREQRQVGLAGRLVRPACSVRTSTRARTSSPVLAASRRRSSATSPYSENARWIVQWISCTARSATVSTP